MKSATTTRHSGSGHIGVAPRPWIPACAGKTRGDGRLTRVGWGVRRIDEGETDKYQVEHPRCHCGRYSRGPAPLDSGLRRKDEGRRPHIRWNTQDVIPDGIRVAPRPWVPACAGKTRGGGRISGGTPKMSLRTVFAWPRAPGFRPAPERRGETAAYQVGWGVRRIDEGRRTNIRWNIEDVITDGPMSF